MKRILFIGLPNSGKTTLFNRLTGLKRKVANYSGITFEAFEGMSRYGSHEDTYFVDLPGIYGIYPNSPEEAITLKYLADVPIKNSFHLICFLIDIDRMETSLAMASQIREHFPQVYFIFTKNDDRKFTEDNRKEFEQILQAPCSVISSKNLDEKKLIEEIEPHINESDLSLHKPIPYTTNSTEFYQTELKDSLNFKNVEQDLLLLHMEHHQKSARALLQKSQKNHAHRVQTTQGIDQILLNPFIGPLFFIAVFYFLFHSIYTFSSPLMDLIESTIAYLGETISVYIVDEMLRDLVINGIFAGVGGVIVFLPQIVILFILISILEQSGYIARASMLMDRLMGFFGLSGRSFLPYLSGFACSIPAIMATRTIANPRERMATLMTIPLITCSARIPVYVLLIGTFIPERTLWGIFHSQALSFFFLYFLGSIMALIIAKVLRLSYFKGKESVFHLELPTYQIPSVKVALKSGYLKGMSFLKKAGTIILGLSVFIWFLSTYPKTDLSQVNEDQQASVALENSFMGKLGKTIEPLLRPIGMDWKIGIGVLAAFGARELFVSTIGTVYAIADADEENESLRERLHNEINPVTGEKVYSLATAWSILIFFVFALQCISTLAIIKKETDGYKIPILMFTYMSILAYGGSFIVYHLLK